MKYTWSILILFSTFLSIGQIKSLVKSDYYLETGSDEILRATKSIRLTPNTHIKTGSSFKAFITPDVFAPWKVGKGSTEDFNQNGSANENIRELGKNHVGEQVVLWKAKPDASVNADGGWNSKYIAIDHTQTYRFSVWIKKTNSNSGATYFGCRSQDNILKLDGDVNNNPYFWYGDLPLLNRWYLLVGFVHGSDYTSKVSYGGIYDGTTGEKVVNTTDFKFKVNAQSVAHRAYLYYDANTLDSQYFYRPRIDLINGKEFTIKELLRVNDRSKLVVSFDSAGNQTKALYCDNSTSCNSPSSSSFKAKPSKQDTLESDKDMYFITDEKHIETPEDASLFSEEDKNKDYSDTKEDVEIYPNPTQGLVTLNFTGDVSKIYYAGLYHVSSIPIKKLRFGNKSTIQVDLSNLITGVYLIHIQLKEGKIITKKIIKK